LPPKELFLPSSDFTARVDRLIEMTKAGDRADGAEEILVRGESELRARERSLKEGVPLGPSRRIGRSGNTQQKQGWTPHWR
jgi:LDH2 family malate/lactate/ureidoglycolate dehydrogenase